MGWTGKVRGESAVMFVSRLAYLFMTSDEIYDSSKLLNNINSSFQSNLIS